MERLPVGAQSTSQGSNARTLGTRTGVIPLLRCVMIGAAFDSTLGEEPPLSDLDRNSNDAAARTPWLLIAGAAIGLALATAGLIETPQSSGELAQDGAATVGERSIRRVDYLRVLAGVENDMRSPIDDAMRRRVLDRMIDEELLVQRALDLGLAVIDRKVRGDLTSGLIDSIVNEADAEEPNEREVARHYEENVDFFTRPGRIRAQTLFFSSRRDVTPRAVPAAERAAEAARRLAEAGSGADLALVESELADRQVSPLPNALLPASKIRDYVGPTLLQKIEQLEVGAWSAPIENAENFYLAQMIEREPKIVPPLSEIAELVRQDLKRRRGDEALRDYLSGLRGEIAVQVNESIFPAQVDDSYPSG